MTLKKSFATVELGTGEAQLLADIVRQTRQICQSHTELRFGALPYREGEIMHSQADISQMQSLGWSPLVNLSKGLTLTVQAEMEQLTQ